MILYIVLYVLHLWVLITSLAYSNFSKTHEDDMTVELIDFLFIMKHWTIFYYDNLLIYWLIIA